MPNEMKRQIYTAKSAFIAKDMYYENKRKGLAYNEANFLRMVCSACMRADAVYKYRYGWKQFFHIYAVYKRSLRYYTCADIVAGDDKMPCVICAYVVSRYLL